MSGGTISAVPEQGQIAVLRQGRYVVTDVHPSQLPAPGGMPQHLVTASSIEDDALGEEIQVVWETEVGAQGLDRVLLPSPANGFDDPRRLAAFLDAVRWGAASQADVRSLQAPFRSGITLEDYQLEPLVRALQMPRVNLLIADDVGLGKTIESGLVCQELLLRHRARRVLIVCPLYLEVVLSCTQNSILEREQIDAPFGGKHRGGANHRSLSFLKIPNSCQGHKLS